MAELWDVYTGERVKTGLTVLRGERLPQGCYRIAVLCCIFNSEGKILIQKRADSTEKWPGYYDLSCGGSAISGEDSASAMERELFEELGIRHSFRDTLPNLIIPSLECFVDIYLLNLELDISELELQAQEVASVEWADISDIFRLIDEGKFIPYNKGLLESFGFLRCHRGLKEEKHPI